MTDKLLKNVNLDKAAKSMKELGEEIKQTCVENTIYTWSASKLVNPLAIKKTKGFMIEDYNGKQYYDITSGLINLNIGHSHPKIIQAIKDQADKLTFAHPGMATEIRAQASTAILKKLPNEMDKVFFALGGAEANENAIKFAKIATGKFKVIARTNSYHGATHKCVSLTSDIRRSPVEPLTSPGIIRTLNCYKYRCPIYKEGMPDEEYADRLLHLLETQIINENPNTIACMIVEPITGTNGVIAPPNTYMPKLLALLHKYNILLIADEVMTGFGRTGKMWGMDNFNTVPDIMTTAKGLTAGHTPGALVALHRDVSKHFETKPYMGGLTYNSHPMCLAAIPAVLEVMEEENVIENSRRLGKILEGLLEEVKDKHPCVGDVRCHGLFSVMEIVKNKETKEPSAPAMGGSSEIMQHMNKSLIDNGAVGYVFSNYFNYSPPLNINEEQLRESFKIVDKVLSVGDKYCH